MSESSEEKVFQPTELKLERLREEQGQFATSPEFVGTVVFLFGIGFVYTTGRLLVDRTQAYQRQILDLIPEDFATASLAGAGGALEVAGFFLAGFLLLLAVVVLLISFVVNKGLVISFQRVSPDFNKLNPVEGVKNLFSLESLVILLKGMLKGVLIAIIGTVAFVSTFDAAFWSPSCTEVCWLQVLSNAVGWVIGPAAAILLVLAAADIRISQAVFMHRHRMTPSEMKQENKEQFGSPELRGERNRLRDEFR